MKTLKTTPKISVRIWRPLIEHVDAKLDSECIRRDAYLTRLLGVETAHLDHEVSIANTPEAQALVTDRLDRLDRKLVSLALDPEVVKKLGEVCRAKGIVRDAFFNRIYLLLAASPRVIDKLFFPDAGKEWRQVVWDETNSNSLVYEGLFYPLDGLVMPFWAIRTALEVYGEDEAVVAKKTKKQLNYRLDMDGNPDPLDSVYTTFFSSEIKGGDLTGLNCYVAPWRIPGTDAELKRRKSLDELLEGLQ